MWQFLRGIFKRQKDASGSIPATKLTQALTDAYAPVIPDSEAAAAGSISLALTSTATGLWTLAG